MTSEFKKVNDFIDTAAKLYGYEVTGLKRREIKYKLAMADIKEDVKQEDYNFALGLVLAELKPKTGSVKTAAVHSSTSCPRCSSHMCNVKIGNTADAMYCSVCHVTVPLR